MGWVLGCARATQGPSSVIVTDGTYANAPVLPEEMTHWSDGEKEVGGAFGALGVCVWGDGEGNDRQRRDPSSGHVAISRGE